MRFTSLLIALFQLACFTTGSKWTLLDQLSVATASDTQISPDGRFVAVIATNLSIYSSASGRGVQERRSPTKLKKGLASFRQHMLVLDAYHSEREEAANSLFDSVVDFCDQAGDCDQPRWSMDGKRLTFLSKGGDISGLTGIWFTAEGSSSIWTSPKLLIIDSTLSSILYHSWSLDSQGLAYTVPLSQPLDDTVREVNDDVIIDVIADQTTVDKYQLCVLQDVNVSASNTPMCFDSIMGSVGFPAWYISCWPHPSQFSWTKSSLLFTHTNNTLANDWPSMGVSALEVTSGVSTLLSEQMFQPVWSPDGQLFTTAKLDLHYWVWSQAWVLCVGDSSALTEFRCDSTGSFDREPQIIGFTADNRFILYTEQKSMSVILYAAEVLQNATSPEQSGWQIGPHHEVGIQPVVPSAVISNVAVAVSDGQTYLTFSAENSISAPEVFAARLTYTTVGLPIASAIQVSQLNPHNPSEYNFNHSVVQWSSRDGTAVEGILLQPSPSLNSSGPLVVFIHTGPNLAHTNTYLGFGGVGARYPVVTMVQHGISVLMPNIRGSSGYGPEWRAAIYRDWGGKDLDDAMYGALHLVKLGVADINHVSVIGWSYGGYMASMALVRCQKDYNFSLAAAVVGGGIVDLISHTGTADISAILANTFGGYYWQPGDFMALYQNRSAMFSIADAQAPTLVQHGGHDPRVPLLQAFQLHFALKTRGVITRMLVYPDSGHIPSRADQLFNIWAEGLAWIETHG